MVRMSGWTRAEQAHHTLHGARECLSDAIAEHAKWRGGVELLRPRAV